MFHAMLIAESFGLIVVTKEMMECKRLNFSFTVIYILTIFVGYTLPV